MIERTFPIDGATIEVAFQWETGAGPGIPDGWGEETGAIVDAGPIRTAFVFEPNVYTNDPGKYKPVGEWAITEIQSLYLGEPNERGTRPMTVLTIEEHPAIPERPTGWHIGDDRRVEPRRMTLSDVPFVLEVVTTTWEQVQAREAVERAVEAVWDAEEHLHEEGGQEAERAVEALRAERDRLKAEYEEKYTNEEVLDAQ